MQSIRFNRNEWSGAFGDIGTDLPLIIGMLLATDLSAANVLIGFGLLQMLTGLIYRMPMPVQPLKAVAMIVIAGEVPGAVIAGGSLAIGVIMLLLTVTGLLTVLAHYIPKPVVRGIQMGLGIQLSLVALKDYLPSLGLPGLGLALVGFLIGVILLGNRRFPPALPILASGMVFSLFFQTGWMHGFSLSVPAFSAPDLSWQVILTGFLVLALPQIPLSLGNSILATHQLANDYFPEKKITIPKIGWTYSIMNLITPFAGGIPVCHGSGGIAGHYTFGGRTGGSTIIYGLFFVLLGTFFSSAPTDALSLFPKPVLGVILLFEGIALILLVKDILTDRKVFFIAVLVALCAVGLPSGYLIGLLLGTTLYYLRHRFVLTHFGHRDTDH